MPDSTTSNSITRWFVALRRGDSLAAHRLWDAYFGEICRLASRTLAARSRTTAFDEEDVAADVLGNFFTQATRGNHAEIRNRDDLWQLLVIITVRRARMLARRERALKRGGGRVALQSEVEAGGQFHLDQLIGEDQGASFSQFLSHQCRQLLELLEDPQLERIALAKLAGHTNEEIAIQQGCTRVTIQRKLRLIRSAWGEEYQEANVSPSLPR